MNIFEIEFKPKSQYVKTATVLIQGRCATYKKPTAQTAHLVFADTKANAEKPKELFFANALTEIE